MTESEAKLGTRVRSLREFSEVPAGTEGVIEKDYGNGIMIAWDLPNQPLPEGYAEYVRASHSSGIDRPNDVLRDGFDKKCELQFLEIVL